MAESAKHHTKFASVSCRIPLPPLRREQADVARFERGRFERRGHGQRRRASRDDVEHLVERHTAITNRTTDEAIAFVGELRAIVFEVDVEEPWRHALGERDGILANSEGIARVEHDADVVAGVGRERQQFLAAEVLVIFDADAQALVARGRGFTRQHGPPVCDERRPPAAVRRTRTFEHGRQVHADERAPQALRNPSRISKRLAERVLQPRAADDRHAGSDSVAGNPVECVVVECGEPAEIELERPRLDVVRDADESVEPDRLRIRTRCAQSLQAQRVREAVRIEAEAEGGRHAKGWEAAGWKEAGRQGGWRPEGRSVSFPPASTSRCRTRPRQTRGRSWPARHQSSPSGRGSRCRAGVRAPWARCRRSEWRWTRSSRSR